MDSQVSEEMCDDNIEAAEMDDGDQHDVNNVIEDSSGDAYPLLFFYDCETTGFSVYDKHITEIAAKGTWDTFVIIQPTNLLKPCKNQQKLHQRKVQIRFYRLQMLYRIAL